MNDWNYDPNDDWLTSILGYICLGLLWMLLAWLAPYIEAFLSFCGV